MPEEDYTAFVSEEDGLRKFSSGAVIGSSTAEGTDVGPILTTGSCKDCETVFVLIGEDFQHVSSNERSMGEERQYVSVTHAYCENCEQDLMLEIGFWEYPEGPIEAYGLSEKQNAKYVDIINIGLLV